MRNVAPVDGLELSTPAPESEPVILTESRGEDALQMFGRVVVTSTPSPEPEPEEVSKSRGENVSAVPTGVWTVPAPEDEEFITRGRGETVAHGASAGGGGGGEENERVTAVRGEDFAVAVAETRERGETSAGTGTFSRGEGDFDATYFLDGTEKTADRGESSDFESRVSIGVGVTTESKDGRGTLDYDVSAAAVFDSSLDDPTDVRRKTVLGALAARQKAAADVQRAS